MMGKTSFTSNKPMGAKQGHLTRVSSLIMFFLMLSFASSVSSVNIDTHAKNLRAPITIGAYTYTFEGTTVSISGKGTDLDKAKIDAAYQQFLSGNPGAQAPDTVKFTGDKQLGLPQSGDRFNSWTGLKKLDFSEHTGGNIKINSQSIQNCPNLAEVIFPSKISRLGVQTFLNDVKLVKLELPECAEFIDKQCFEGCTGLTTVHFKGYSKYGSELFKGCTALKEVYWCPTKEPEVAATSYEKKFFGIDLAAQGVNFYVQINYPSDKFVEVTLTAANKKLSDDCTIPTLKEVTVDNIKYQFYGPVVSITNLDQSAKNIGKANLDSAITQAGLSVSITIMKFIGSNPFNILMNNGFNQMTSLEKLDFSESTSETNDIQTGTFQQCSNLAEVLFAPKMKRIGVQSFLECTKLNKLEFYEVTDYIDKNCFQGCTGLTSVRFNNAVKLGNGLFDGCSSLTSIFWCPTSEPEKAYPANDDLVGSTGGKVYVKSSYSSNKFGKLGITDENKALDDSCNPNFGEITKEPFVFTFKGSSVTIIAKSSGTLSKSLVEQAYSEYKAGSPSAPDYDSLYLEGNNQFKFNENAFNGFTKLKVFDMSKHTGENIEFSSRSAQSLTSLERLLFPAKISKIGVDTFKGATKITTLILPGTSQYIDSTAFSGCSALTTVKFSSFTKYGTNLFASSPNLKEVYWCDSRPPEIASSSYDKNMFDPSVLPKIKLYLSKQYTGGAKFAEVDVTYKNRVLDQNCEIDSTPPTPDPTPTATPRPSQSSTPYGLYYYKFLGNVVSLKGNGPFSKETILQAYKKSIDGTIVIRSNDIFTPFNQIQVDGTNIVIDESAFQDDEQYEVINFINTQTIEIKKNAFNNCRSLRKINFEDKVTSIGDYGLKGMKSIYTFSFANDVYIGELAFDGCTNLNMIDFGGQATINEAAFHDCTSLRAIYYNSRNPPTTNGQIFVTGTKGNYVSFSDSVTIYVPTNYDSSSFGEKENINKVVEEDSGDGNIKPKPKADNGGKITGITAGVVVVIVVVVVVACILLILIRKKKIGGNKSYTVNKPLTDL